MFHAKYFPFIEPDCPMVSPSQSRSWRLAALAARAGMPGWCSAEPLCAGLLGGFVFGHAVCFLDFGNASVGGLVGEGAI